MTSEKVSYQTSRFYESHDVSFYEQSGHLRRKPLIDYCTNEWRTDPRYASDSPPSTIYAASENPNEEWYDKVEDWVDNVVAVIKAPRFRRLFFTATFFLITTIVLWVKVVEPWIAEEKAAYESLTKETTANVGKVYGTNMRPQFPGVTQISDLSPEFLPNSSKLGSKRRLVFIGDIHGCKRELVALLEKVAYNAENDHIVAVGDIVNKGPDSRGVIDLLMAHNASCVRGNHDDRIVLVAKEQDSSAVRPNKQQAVLTENLEKAKPSREKEKDLAKSLTKKQIAYLESFPLILRIGNIPNMGDVVVVHGGLVPGVPYDNQDPISIMHTRIIDLKTHVPSSKHKEKGCIAWFKLWNKHEKLLSLKSKKAQHTTIIYGHDSKRGLKINQYTKGLDTGCAGGGKLTALVVNHKGQSEVVQVDCEEYTIRKPQISDLDDILRSGQVSTDTGDDD